jgi:cell fate (sporulation/competence/biofilm development) regulator YmcA (YheA/YmcA/DUF963 family)
MPAESVVNALDFAEVARWLVEEVHEEVEKVVLVMDYTSSMRDADQLFDRVFDGVGCR